MNAYGVWFSPSRRIVLVSGLAIGLQIVTALCPAQAQVQTQTAETVPIYHMPSGAAPPQPTVPTPIVIRTLIPGGDEALEEIKNRPMPAGQRPAAAQQAPATPAVSTSCQLNSSVGIPPSDIHGAAGPTNVVTVTNVEVGVYNKSSCSLVGKVTLRDFFARFSIPATQTIFDPRVLYDPGSGRFFLTAESKDTGNTDQYQYFAVSTSSAGTLPDWYKYRATLSQGSAFFCKQAANRFWDYPSAGYSSARWLITANDFLGTTATGAILSIDKAPSLSGIAPNATCINHLPGDIKLASNIAAPTVLDSSSTPFFLSPGAKLGSSITRYRLNQGSDSSFDTLTTTSAITIPSWSAAPSAAQPNGQTLDSGDGRFQSATIQNGTSLWNVHAVYLGGPVARFYQFSTTGTEPLVTGDLYTAGDDKVFNPSIATNATRAFVTATRTWPSAGSPTGNAAMLIFSGPNNSASGWGFDLVATSASQFTQEYVSELGMYVACNTVNRYKTRASCRWGDYSATQVDPSATTHAWGFNELVTGTNSSNWTTRGALVSGCGGCC